MTNATKNYIPMNPHIVEKIWGSSKLSQMKGIKSDTGFDLKKIGETWEVSLLEEGPSFDKEGRPIADIIGKDAFQYLVKFIDTSDDLSVQVHPGDEYAKLHENSLGKSECWFILAADAGCGIYLGLKEGVDKSRLEKAISEKENVSELLNFIPITPGDFFFVPAGTIHAIGRGVTLAEVQQSSGITYRVWDWNRKDSEGRSRELHIEKALDVINFDTQANQIENFKPGAVVKNKGLSTLIEHRDFNLDYYELKGPSEVEISRDLAHRPSSILNLGHELNINGQVISPYQAILIKGDEKLNLKTGPQEGDLSDTVSFLYIY